MDDNYTCNKMKKIIIHVIMDEVDNYTCNNGWVDNYTCNNGWSR